MKYAVLSDIHANLEAFERVIEKCRSLGVESYISLGDTVGYNANPRECVEIVRSLPFVACIKGNHDEYASNNDEIMEGFNHHARAAVLWTKHQLEPEMREWLAALPMKKIIKGIPVTVVHATLDSPDTWGYIFDPHRAADNFNYQFTQLCFCGHSHAPLAYCRKPVTMYSDKPIEEMRVWITGEDDAVVLSRFTDEASVTLKLEQGYRYLLNVGSVGQPRNHDPRASFAVYDTEAKTVTRYCLPYDVETAQKKILAAGLPERLAWRLGEGS